MFARFFACLLLFASTCAAQDVRYAVSAVATGTNTPLTVVKEGQSFDLVVKVRDLRAGTWPRGVFAAYCNIYWRDAGTGEVKPGALSVNYVQYRGPYQNGKHNAVWSDSIRELGAFDGFSPLGIYEREVVRVNATAKAGTYKLEPSFVELSRPAYDTLVYAYPGREDQKIPPERLITRSVTLTVEKP